MSVTCMGDGGGRFWTVMVVTVVRWSGCGAGHSSLQRRAMTPSCVQWDPEQSGLESAKRAASPAVSRSQICILAERAFLESRMLLPLVNMEGQVQGSVAGKVF